MSVLPSASVFVPLTSVSVAGFYPPFPDVVKDKPFVFPAIVTLKIRADVRAVTDLLWIVSLLTCGPGWPVGSQEPFEALTGRAASTILSFHATHLTGLH